MPPHRKNGERIKTEANIAAGGIKALRFHVFRDMDRSQTRLRISLQLKDDRVTIASGIFETPMMSGLPQDVQESLGKSVPFPSRLSRQLEHEAFAKHVIENSMLNGDVIRLDGALRMAPR